MKHRWKIILKLSLLALLGASLALTSGCNNKKTTLTIYAGKGIKNSMEEIKQSFENKHHIPLSIIYAGSNTLLTTIQKSKKGDIFIPGSLNYIKQIQDQVTTNQHIADHIPTFAVRTDNAKQLTSYKDIMQEGIKIAVGNHDMCAIGKVAEKIISNSNQQELFRNNIVITGSTVNELLSLVVNNNVDASLIWEDMLQWPEAKALHPVAIPDAINTPKEIHIAVLKYTTNPKQAAIFVDFVATEGKAIFAKNGFRVR